MIIAQRPIFEEDEIEGLADRRRLKVVLGSLPNKALMVAMEA